MLTSLVPAAAFAAALVTSPAVAAGTSVVFAPEAVPLSVSPDGRVFGSRVLEVRVSRPDSPAGQECRKVRRIDLVVDGRTVASAEPGKGEAVCGFSETVATLRGEVITERDAQELCRDQKGGVTRNPEVEVVFDDGEVTWTEEAREVAVAISCGTGCPPPEIVSPAVLPPATAGKHYAATLAVSGGYQPLSFSHIEGDLPPGIRISPAGVISGNPAAPGTYAFTMQAKDKCPEGAQAVRKKLTLKVEAPCPPLSVSGGNALPDATVGREYAHPLRVIGALPPVTFTLASGELPEGLALAPDGKIAGRPAAAGISSFTLRATDSCPSGSRTTERTFGVTVYDHQQRGTGAADRLRGEWQRKELEALDPLRKTRDEMAGLLVRFDEDVERYRKAMSEYNARLAGCEGGRYTPAERRSAGCTEGESELSCYEKLVAACMGDARARADEAQRRVREDAAGVSAAAAALEELTTRMR